MIDSVEELLAVVSEGGLSFDEEDVDQLAHALQCSALLARDAPDDIELQVAGLVHDIGSIVAPGAPATHAGTGAAIVAPLLGTRVARLVALHADAKRYLTTTDRAYRARLSSRSIETLEDQGGMLDPAARRAFESDPLLPDALTLRRADDSAKVPGAVVPDLSTWRSVVGDLARARPSPD